MEPDEKDIISEEELEVIDTDEDWDDATVDLITLTDEEGVDHDFELVDTMECDGTVYVALISGPENPDMLEGDGNLVIMKSSTDEDGEEYLELIEDDDEFDKISSIFMDRLSDLFEFEEEWDPDDE